MPSVPQRSVIRIAASVVAAVVVGAGALGAGLWLAERQAGEDAADQLVDVTEDPGVVHVHGLGVDPADGALYAATHTGVFRISDGGAERVTAGYQDTMGFTVAGAGRFLASGHPDLRDPTLRVEGKPPLLGLVESTDGGRTWDPVSLLGDADLHGLATAGGLILAADSTGERVLASADGGSSWETRSPTALVDLALDPADPGRAVGATLGGDVLLSDDGGRTWRPPSSAPPPGVSVVRWGEGGLWAGTVDGTLAMLDRSGRWRELQVFGEAIEALLLDGRTAYAAVASEGILRSDDGGMTWTAVYQSS